MSQIGTDWRPDLSDASRIRQLQPRHAPYFNLVAYCRHIGVAVKSTDEAYWVARIRKRDGGYMQRQLFAARRGGEDYYSYDDAAAAAQAWFETKSVKEIAAPSYPVGSKRNLIICPVGETYSVGHALEEYIKWKRIAATRSHFETLISLINYYLVPMTSHITLEQFTGAHFQELAMHVLESTPRRGRRSLKQKKRSINELDDDELRKRKKTFNSLVSILRGAFQIAWDNGNLESDRPLRCLKRLPNVDRPRTIYLSRDECRRLISASGPDLKVLVRAALYSGCRIRELTALRVRDVLMGQKCIFISFPKGHRARHVFLPTEGTHFFESIAAGRHSGDVLFRKQNGRAWGGEYKDYFRAARDRANLPQLLTFHGLRHTYASQLIENGAPHAVVAAQLGHVDIRTVCSTYGHLTSSLREREVQRHFENIDGCGTKPQHAPTTTPLQQRLLPDPVVSWPRCNFSTYSGPLLGVLKPKCDF